MDVRGRFLLLLLLSVDGSVGWVSDDLRFFRAVLVRGLSTVLIVFWMDTIQ